jgi:subtilisin family serine protease/tetratricopeptide (TPR) repeat protein
VGRVVPQCWSRLSRALWVAACLLVAASRAATAGVEKSPEDLRAECLGGRWEPLDKCLVACRAAAGRRPADAAIAVELGRVLVRSGRRDRSQYSDAWAVLTRAITLDPSRGDAYALCALTALELGLDAAAEQYVMHAEKLGAEKATTMTVRAIQALRSHEPQRARDLAKDALDCETGNNVKAPRCPDPDSTFRLAQVLTDAGDLRAARDALVRLEKESDTDPNKESNADPDVVRLRAKVLLDLAAAEHEDGERRRLLDAAAREANRPALTAHPEGAVVRSQVYTQLAEDASSRERVSIASKAIAQLCTRIAGSLPSAELYVALGDLLAAAGNRDRAFAAYRRAALVAPDHVPAYEGIRRLFGSAPEGQPEAVHALWALWKLAQLAPTSDRRDELTKRGMTESATDDEREHEGRKMETGQNPASGVAQQINLRLGAPVKPQALLQLFDVVYAGKRTSSLEPVVWPKSPCNTGTTSLRDLEPAIVFAGAEAVRFPSSIEKLTSERRRALGVSSTRTVGASEKPLTGLSVTELDAEIDRREDATLLREEGAFVGSGLRWHIEPMPIRVPGAPPQAMKKGPPSPQLLALCDRYRIDPTSVCQYRNGVISGQGLATTLLVPGSPEDSKTLLVRLRKQVTPIAEGRAQFSIPIAAMARSRLKLTPDTESDTGAAEFDEQLDVDGCDDVAGDVIETFSDVKTYVEAYYDAMDYTPDLDSIAEDKKLAGIFLLDAFKREPPTTPNIDSSGAIPVYVPTHPELKPLPSDGTKPSTCLTAAATQLGHGQHLLGLIKAGQNGFGMVGIAPFTEVRPVGGGSMPNPKDPNDYGVSSSDLKRLLGVIGDKYVADHSWVLNTSFVIQKLDDEDRKRLIQTIDTLRNSVLVVAAASDRNIFCVGQCNYVPGGLGNLPNVVTVTGIGPAIDPPRLLATPGGPTSDTGSIISLAAPAWRVLGPEGDDSYSLRVGSSEATALVSGVASLLLRRGLSPFQAKEQLIATSQFSIAYENNEPEILGGVVDARAALRSICSDVIVRAATPEPPLKGRIVIDPSFRQLRIFKSSTTQESADAFPNMLQVLRVHREPTNPTNPQFTVVWSTSSDDVIFELRNAGVPHPRSEVNTVQVVNHAYLQVDPSPYDCKMLSTEQRAQPHDRPCLQFKTIDGAAATPLFLDQVNDIYFGVRGAACGT